MRAASPIWVTSNYFFDQKYNFFDFLGAQGTAGTNLLAFAQRKLHFGTHENAEAPSRHLYHRDYQLADCWPGRFRLKFSHRKSGSAGGHDGFWHDGTQAI
jgi:hypothetical protein